MGWPRCVIHAARSELDGPKCSVLVTGSPSSHRAVETIERRDGSSGKPLLALALILGRWDSRGSHGRGAHAAGRRVTMEPPLWGGRIRAVSIRRAEQSRQRSGYGDRAPAASELRIVFYDREAAWGGERRAIVVRDDGLVVVPGHPRSTPALTRLLDDLDALVVEAGGRVYLAKDARLGRDRFNKMYPRSDQFRKVCARVDPLGLMQSDLSRRLAIR